MTPRSGEERGKKSGLVLLTSREVGRRALATLLGGVEDENKSRESAFFFRSGSGCGELETAGAQPFFSG